MLAELVDYVVGVDPDRDRVTVAIVDAMTGGEIESAEFPTTAHGYAAAVSWADEHSSADSRVWAIEGTGSYGSGLTQTLVAEGEWVIEFDHPNSFAGTDRAKSDRLDALRAARETLGRKNWAQPRARGPREALRTLLTTRSGALKDRTRATNKLKALVLSAPVALRDDLAGLSTIGLIGTCARMRPAVANTQELAGTKTSMRALARRINMLSKEIDELTAAMEPLVEKLGPQLLDEIGIGHVLAAQILVSWSHPGRCRDAAAFCRLSGTAPIEATSGQNQTRHRLNRGGDRQLNRALHQIILVRTTHDQRTKDYYARREAEGKTRREARRCLKRYLARHLYRILETPPQTPNLTT